MSNVSSSSSAVSQLERQHGVKGVYYGGDWLDLEDCDKLFSNPNDSTSSTAACKEACLQPCPRSRTRVVQSKDPNSATYDVVIVGAGCIGAAIARELSKYQLSVLWLEAADDVSQGATKGNSGIVHAGYDDKPGTNRAKYCWPGNQMFADLDKELRFGYQKNGSLVVAFNSADSKHLRELKQRGEKNGVQNLRIVQQDELRKMEPHIHPDAIAALHSPDAGNVIPFEFAIALAENAVDNGVELRLRRQVQDIKVLDGNSNSNGSSNFQVTAEYWEPAEYIQAVTGAGKEKLIQLAAMVIGGLILAHYLVVGPDKSDGLKGQMHVFALIVVWMGSKAAKYLFSEQPATRSTPMVDLVKRAGEPAGKSGGEQVTVADMLVGGSGAHRLHTGKTVAKEVINCQYIINCAGGAADQVARLIGDASFKIKPRVGDYIMLNRNQGHLANSTLFPCPHPKLGKGVLVQTTLWGNLILGPTARDMHEPAARDMSSQSVQEYILSKCKHLVPSFDAAETIHAFCGARAKSDRGDWIIEPSAKHAAMIHVAGIDSPGLAGSPAIAVDVVQLLKKAGLSLSLDPTFKKDRAPIITPKDGWKGLRVGPVGKNDDGTTEKDMAKNVICKCERVTELEVVRALRRSLPIDSSQAIRKRTRAGMGHCQGDPDNYNCEGRVRAIIARENGVPVTHVGARPWPATSTLTERWIGTEEKQALAQRKEQAA